MSTNAPLPLLSSRILVFSDFNCPYCFTLDAWLNEMSVSHRVRWVGIEHKPLLPRGGQNAVEDATILAREVADVGARAPDLGVRPPPFWCNSRDALLLQNAVEVDDPALAPSIRRRLFRGYWVDGRLLCDPAVLNEVRAELPDVDLVAEAAELDRLTAWWREHVDRIPAMFAPTGVVHLGLQNRDTVWRFVQSAIAEAEPGPGCL
ncbi:MAG: hypothetical protein EXR72_19245 [Myxococcales bacterium]|nr:hypothetical protein [Myxococcales bacterium]